MPTSLTGVIYRSPTVTDGVFQKALMDIMKHVPQNCSCIMTGDFNKDVSSQPRQVQFKALEHFDQLITECTYYEGAGQGSLLDHVYTRNCDVVRSGVLNTYYSDHDPVFVQVQH